MRRCGRVLAPGHICYVTAASMERSRLSSAGGATNARPFRSPAPLAAATGCRWKCWPSFASFSGSCASSGCGPSSLRSGLECAKNRSPKRLNEGPPQSLGLTLSNETDVEFAQLLGSDFRRRAHHQVLGALVHRKENDLAQIFFAAQEHDNAVDARRNPAVRRCAKR